MEEDAEYVAVPQGDADASDIEDTLEAVIALELSFFLSLFMQKY